MNSNKNIILLGLLAALLMGCGKRGSERSKKDIKSNSMQFETVAETPIRTSSVFDQSTDSASTTTSEGAVNPFLPGPQMLPNGPVLPPTALDDDFFHGEPFGVFEEFDPGLGLCGNKFLDLKEQCDDGNLLPGDGCSPICRFEFCGNGFVDFGELCDSGMSPPADDGCTSRCLFRVCGNARLDENEECDDGNLLPGDGCSPCCLYERCGNGFVDPIIILHGKKYENETCDDGNLNNGDGCSDCCQLEICGNNYTTPNEQCDDGNLKNGDGCSSICIIETPVQAPGIEMIVGDS